MDRFLSNPIIRRVAKNSAYLFSASGIAVALSFFQNLLAANLLGVALLGTLGVIVDFTSVINKLGSFRMHELVVKYVGQYQEENDPPRGAAVFKLACLLETGSSLVSYTLIALLAAWGASLFAKDASFAGMFALYGLIVLGNVIYESATGLLQIFDRFRSISILQAAQSVVTLLLIALAFFAPDPLLAVVGAYMSGKLITGIGIALLAFREAARQWGGGWWRAPLGLLREQRRELFRFAFSTNISATINLVNKDSEKLWVGALLGVTAAGYYKQALALANLVLIPVSPLPQATYPELAREVARKAWDNVRYVLKQGSRLAALYTGAASIFLIVLGRPLIALLYGEEFLPSYPALIVLLVGLLVANTFYWNRTALLSLNLPGFPTKVNLLAAAIKIALTLLLVPRLGYVASAGLLSGYYFLSIGLNVRKTYAVIGEREK
jgi:O-antigen/teichoic acid export membrane protein